MTILLERANIPIPNKIVIPTGAQRSGGTCGYFFPD
jgi:hypothetical protein